MEIGKSVILLLLFAMAAPVMAASGTAYGTCDSPLGQYKCYDKSETSYCPGQGLTYVPGWCPGGSNRQCCAPAETPEGPRTGGPGLPYVGYCDSPMGGYKCYDIGRHACTDGLQYVRGWCLGGNNIQCCAPPGTPAGKRVYGPGIQIELPDNAQVQDFQFFLDGTGTCEYFVKSSDVETKRAAIACGSWGTITVGPNGDCRDEGENVCTVTNGETERAFSITFYNAASAYGACKKYTSSNCLDESECTATGGTPLRNYCLSVPDSRIKCCIYQATYVSDTSSFVYDATGSISVPGIDNQLNLLSQEYDAKIIIEIVDEIPSDAEKNLLNKFDFKYRLQESGKKLTMIILYGKGNNAWRILRGSENCGIEEDTIRNIILDESVSKKAEIGSYDEAFGNLIRLLEAVIAEKSNLGDICRERFDVKDCGKDCDSTILGLNGCSMEKCVNIDGCMWNSGDCENICPGERATEVVVVKKDAAAVSDVYLCRNGLPADPVKAAFSSAPKAVALSSCGGIPQSFIEKYNSYKGIIDSKISKYQLALTDNPNAFVAALISKESAWRESAQSSSSTGLMQINTPAHPECDVQEIMEYDVDANIDCGVKFLSNLARTQTNDVNRKVYDCKGGAYGSIEEVVLRYYNGWPSSCLDDPSREDENFVEDIMGQRENPGYTANYPAWKSCLEQQPVEEGENVFTLPEGNLEISEKATKGGPSSCNINSIPGNYWLGVNNNEKSLQCVGMHGIDSCPGVDISRLFSGVSVGTKVTVKSSSAACSSVCSGIVESVGSMIDSSGCRTRCGQMGCGWENNKCTAAPSCGQSYALNPVNQGAGKVIVYTTEEDFV